MIQTVLFICLGYLSGSVLYALVFARIFGKEDILGQSQDHNPGTANAFMYGGFRCGVFTLIFDLLKGFFPVYLFIRFGTVGKEIPLLAALAIAAPVIGHNFSVFHRFRGGKGIAVTFGCLAGLFPQTDAFVILTFFFIALSTVLQITPHFYRTVFAYAFSLAVMVKEIESPDVIAGFFIITAAVFLRMFMSKEPRRHLEVKLFGCFNTFVWDRRRA